MKDTVLNRQEDQEFTEFLRSKAAEAKRALFLDFSGDTVFVANPES
jgi:hypothetical protein